MQEVEYRELTPELRAELQGDEADPFEMGDLTMEFRHKERHLGLRAPSGRLVAQVGFVVTEVTIEGSDPLAVVGIGGVIVNREHRGSGLGRRIIDRALDYAATLGPDLALLFCLPTRAELYKRHGFSVVPPPVLVQQPGGLTEMPLVTMWRSLRSGFQPPQGQLTLLGLPF